MAVKWVRSNETWYRGLISLPPVMRLPDPSRYRTCHIVAAINEPKLPGHRAEAEKNTSPLVAAAILTAANGEFCNGLGQKRN